MSAVWLLPFLCKGQHADTLPGVKVYGKSVTDITATPTNVQQLDKATLTKLNSVSVADAAKYFSGVVIKDYGGIGGLKTIWVRSLGANHTVVLYDGIAVNDAQGGQIDLGRFSLENIENIVLYINNPADILSPARSFTGAAVLGLSTASARTNERSVLLKIKSGSFGFINPSVSYKANISKRIRHGLFAEYQSANGAYPFKDYETGTTTRKRNNSDIKAYHAEYDVAYYISDSNTVKLKAYYYNSKRGLPGGVIFFNDFSSQRLNNESFFTQLSWKKNLSLKSNLLLCGKYAGDYKYYIDPAYPNSAGTLENEFHQQEFYSAAVFSYKFSSSFSASAAADFFYSKLVRTDTFAVNFANPSRNNYLSNLLLQYKTKNIEVTGNLLFTAITEKAESGKTGRNFQKFTPAVATSILLFKTLPVRIRASYKQIFRAPTFDDLYYTNFGNTDLDPEFVKQYNAGITAAWHPRKVFREIILTADAYYNDVKNKILAVPRQNLFQWTVLNIGKADIKGIDVSGTVSCEKIGAVDISARFSYSFQKALDITPSSSFYNTQLPYTPEHSGSINLFIKYHSFDFSYNVLLSGYRYQLGDPLPGNLVQGWTEQGISLGYNMNVKKYGQWQLTAEMNNIFNQQYEVIKFYPMPRFNYRIGIAAKF